MHCTAVAQQVYSARYRGSQADGPRHDEDMYLSKLSPHCRAVPVFRHHKGFDCAIMLALLSASAALLAPVNTNTRSRAVIMQADRRSVLAAAACLVVPTKAWAGYALGAAAVAEHSTVATGKEREKAVYDSVRASIDAKRPDRPDIGTRAPAPYPYCCCHR